jgi:hypothetical protein
MKHSMFVLWLLLAHALAQVTYSDTPSKEDLEQRFYGGIKVVELTIPENTVLRYMVMDTREMSVLESNDEDFEDRSLYSVPVEQGRFAISVSTTGNFGCESEDLPGRAILTHSFSATYRNPDGSEGIGGGGGNQCVSFNENFNLGHWTDILNASSPLPLNTWIPVTAFIPNYYDGSFTYAPATEWLVLLVLFDDGSEIEEPLEQAGLVERILEYGINPNP